MLDLSKVPVVDSNVEMCSYISLYGTRYIKLKDNYSNSTFCFPEESFNKYFKMFKNVLENERMYRISFASTRGYKWIRPRDIDPSLGNLDYFIIERVPIYIEMFKHVSKYKVCLDRDSLLSQSVYVLKEINKRLKNRKRLSKIKNLPYINL